jgi:hypothetical protein
MSERWIPEPPPAAPRYVERLLTICPDCHGLVRRVRLDITAEGQQYGPWRCAIHGEVAEPLHEWYEIPTGDEEDDA